MSIIARVFDGKDKKVFHSGFYNFVFDKKTGVFARWGRTPDDDPPFSPFGPEILDLEISAGGDCLGRCSFCYKCNGGDQPTRNLSFDDFKIILEKVNDSGDGLLTQIAFGIMNISTNPDFFRMMEHTREEGVIPNYTMHGLDLTDEYADRTAELCGACAVSTVNKKKTYRAVKMLTDRGMKQVNIHFMLAEETVEEAMDMVRDAKRIPDLEKLNAIVFLQYKHKNPKSPYTSIQSVDTYKRLVEHCLSMGVNYGFDSCSFPLFAKSVEDHDDYEKMMMISEPCESSCFSSYINCKGVFFPCSFCEGVEGWETGIDVLGCKRFHKVWGHKKTADFRRVVMDGSKGCTSCKSQKYCRKCPIYSITPCLQVQEEEVS